MWSAEEEEMEVTDQRPQRGQVTTVPACTLLLRLLKCHLLTPLKEVVTNLPFFMKNIFEMLMLPPITIF